MDTCAKVHCLTLHLLAMHNPGVLPSPFRMIELIVYGGYQKKIIAAAPAPAAAQMPNEAASSGRTHLCKGQAV